MIRMTTLTRCLCLSELIIAFSVDVSIVIR